MRAAMCEKLKWSKRERFKEYVRNDIRLAAHCSVSGVMLLICNQIETNGGSSVGQVPWVVKIKRDAITKFGVAQLLH
jgi:hypothetical protein